MLCTSRSMQESVVTMKDEPASVCHSPLVPSLKHGNTQFSLLKPHSSSPSVFKARETGEIKSAPGGDNVNASIPTYGKLEMQTSEACHKGFLIFNHSEGQNTVILHPSWLNNAIYRPPIEHNFTQNEKYDLQALKKKSLEAMLGFHSLAAPAFGDVMEPALSLKPRCGVLDFVNFGQVEGSKKEAKGTGSLLDIGEELQHDFHENTEEINALLSSDDDELSSTGHSPSDVSSNCHTGAKNECINSLIGKKRKLQESYVDEVDDANSGPYKCETDHMLVNYRRSGRWLSLCPPECKGTLSGVEVDNTLSRTNKSLAINHLEQCDMRMKARPCASKCSSGTFGEHGLMDNSKRIKIKSNVQQLKDVIPGGNGLDTAGVLGRTIEYVKCLQKRLRDLEATREVCGRKKLGGNKRSMWVEEMKSWV